MNLKYPFLFLSVLFGAIALAAMFMGQGKMGSMIEGGAKGLAGVFFILFFILVLLGKEPFDKTSSH